MTTDQPEPFVDSSPYFPVLDAPRTDANAELGRAIVDFLGYVEPHIPETDNWCSMPVRLVYDQAGGFHIELGPYGLDAADVHTLRQAIHAYDLANGKVQR